MQKWMFPFRISGRKRCFCSSLPKSMSVGATELMVSIGTGAPARIDSSKKMNWSIGPRPWPPYSVGHPMPSQPSAPIWRTTRRMTGPTPSAWRSSRTVSSSSSSS